VNSSAGADPDNLSDSFGFDTAAFLSVGDSTLLAETVTTAATASLPARDDALRGAQQQQQQSQQNNKQVAQTATTSTATTVNTTPLPFTLPSLTIDQERRLQAGERIQEQSKMGREGSGHVVFDIPAPAEQVWNCLLDFERYPETIGTVRSMRFLSDPQPARHYGTPSVTRALFVLSKFKLNIAAIHAYQPNHPSGHYMEFSLDPSCTNAVLQHAKGIWYTQELQPARRTRVWLMCELRVSGLLPTFIVDYAARRAMPRATSWLRPVVEQRMKDELQTKE
jgi:hypothetical protein